MSAVTGTTEDSGTQRMARKPMALTKRGLAVSQVSVSSESEYHSPRGTQHVSGVRIRVCGALQDVAGAAAGVGRAT